MNRTLIASLGLALLAACTTPQSKPPETTRPAAPTAQLIDRELFFGDPELSSAEVSPDGKFITFRKPYKNVMNLWVKGIDEPFSAARPLTASQRPPGFSLWSWDSRFVLYALDTGGDEDFHLWAVEPTASADPATGVPVARDLTPFPKTRVRFTANPKKTPGQLILGMNDRDPRVHDLYRVELATGKRELLIKNDQNVAWWVTDLDGNLRLGVRTTEDAGTELLAVEDGKLRPVYSCSFEETCNPNRFHKDGERVYLSTNKGDRDLTELVLLEPATGKEELVDRDPEGQVDFAGAEFSNATDELVATYYVGDRLRTYPKEDGFRRDYEALKKALPDGDLYVTSSTLDDRIRTVEVTSDVDPGATYVFDGTQAQLLFRPRPNLPSSELSPMKPVRYTARDGLSIPAYLTVPKGVEAKGLPTVMLVHGGPWGRDTWGYDATAQFLANRGYAVLQPNFRASTGYGKKFLNLGNMQWGTGTMQHDLTDGAAWLVAQGISDPERIAIMGGSYGGYATLAGLAFTPDLYAAGVDIVGPSNLKTLLESIPPYWAPIKKTFEKRMGNLADPEDAARMKAQSPLYSATQIKAPLLVIQGQNDPRVKRPESDQIVAALRDLKRPVSYLVAPDEGHGFRGRENRLAMYAEVERFLAEHLRGRHQEELPEDIAAKLTSLRVDPATVK